MFIKKKRLMEVFPSRWRNLWTEWQLRLLILLSLTTQIILVILGNRRKYIAGAWIRFTVWSTYLVADSIALMAAGIISNEVGEAYNANGLVDEKYELIIFWAPLLLFHLGGADTITAYSLEDNELWRRHLLGVVIQAFATLYIWLTASTSSTPSLLFILMFFVGLGKYCERVWVLYLASEKTFRESIPDIPANDYKLMEKCKLKQLEGYHLTTYPVFVVEVPDHSANTSSTDESLHPDADELLKAYSLVDMVKRLFSDLSLGYQDRVRENHQRSKIDVIITLVSLVVALLLELCAFRELLLSDHTTHWLIKHKKTNFLQHINRTLRHKWQKRRNWSHSISQFSLLSFSLGKTPVPYYGILKMLRIDEMLEIQHDIPLRDIDDIKYIIFEEMKNLRDWAKANNCGTELKYLYGRKGGRTLTSYKREDLDWSVDKLGFDQSILIWHLATEICYFHECIKPGAINTIVNSEGERKPQDGGSAEDLMRQRCNYLSRYMLYLLVRRPNMLPIGMGHIKFRDIYTEVGYFIEEHCGEPVKDEEKASDTLRKVKIEVMPAVGGRDRSRRGRSNYVIIHACRLASELGESGKKWELIKGVWLEMLGHAASQCKGRLHAQQLRRGGELLTHVWLLMVHFGLTDHFQIPQSRAIAEVIVR
ncbi:hypothetical protein ACJW30_07G035200 [Castanea mollissima]